MIVFENKGFWTHSLFPDSDWTGKAKYVVADGTELANKIITLYPYYEFVTDPAGKLIDVTATEKPETKQPQTDTESDLMKMAIDHEYRLTLLELGITEE